MKKWNDPVLKNLSTVCTNDERTSCENYAPKPGEPILAEIEQPLCLTDWDWWVKNVCSKCCLNGKFCWCPDFNGEY
ncbi:MAG: hypothetical protein E6344_13330 [Clostridium sp.]|nr:hypothetical protein [Clostridium sp.]MDU7084677.1 hypothetical protein [Clostridium sp.]